jgi:hypothetical protein
MLLMKKNKKTNEKESPIARLIFKILVAIAIIIITFIVIDRTSFSTDSLDFMGRKQDVPKSKIPHELKWFDDFKGVENVPTEKDLEENKDKPGSFLQYQTEKNKKK